MWHKAPAGGSLGCSLPGCEVRVGTLLAPPGAAAGSAGGPHSGREAGQLLMGLLRQWRNWVALVGGESQGPLPAGRQASWWRGAVRGRGLAPLWPHASSRGTWRLCRQKADRQAGQRVRTVFWEGQWLLTREAWVCGMGAGWCEAAAMGLGQLQAGCARSGPLVVGSPLGLCPQASPLPPLWSSRSSSCPARAVVGGHQAAWPPGWLPRRGQS